MKFRKMILICILSLSDDSHRWKIKQYKFKSVTCMISCRNSLYTDKIIIKNVYQHLWTASRQESLFYKQRILRNNISVWVYNSLVKKNKIKNR